jgi:hypothetical protein
MFRSGVTDSRKGEKQRFSRVLVSVLKVRKSLENKGLSAVRDATGNELGQGCGGVAGGRLVPLVAYSQAPRYWGVSAVLLAFPRILYFCIASRHAREINSRQTVRFCPKSTLSTPNRRSGTVITTQKFNCNYRTKPIHNPRLRPNSPTFLDITPKIYNQTTQLDSS